MVTEECKMFGMYFRSRCSSFHSYLINSFSTQFPSTDPRFDQFF